MSNYQLSNKQHEISLMGKNVR